MLTIKFSPKLHRFFHFDKENHTVKFHCDLTDLVFQAERNLRGNGWLDETRRFTSGENVAIRNIQGSYEMEFEDGIFIFEFRSNTESIDGVIDLLFFFTYLFGTDITYLFEPSTLPRIIDLQRSTRIIEIDQIFSNFSILLTAFEDLLFDENGIFNRIIPFILEYATRPPTPMSMLVEFAILERITKGESASSTYVNKGSPDYIRMGKLSSMTQVIWRFLGRMKFINSTLLLGAINKIGIDKLNDKGTTTREKIRGFLKNYKDGYFHSFYEQYVRSWIRYRNERTLAHGGYLTIQELRGEMEKVNRNSLSGEERLAAMQEFVDTNSLHDLIINIADTEFLSRINVLLIPVH